jgi:hypothetical protein
MTVFEAISSAPDATITLQSQQLRSKIDAIIHTSPPTCQGRPPRAPRVPNVATTYSAGARLSLASALLDSILSSTGISSVCIFRLDTYALAPAEAASLR